MATRAHRKRRKSKSSKGALLKGMSRRLPSELLENPLFQKKLKELMQGYGGIYALYRGKKLYYTGLTGNLFGRIRWHTKDRHERKWDHFIVFRIQKVKYLKDIETLLHHLVETRGNRNQGKVPRDADFNRVLRTLVKDHRRMLRSFERALK